MYEMEGPRAVPLPGPADCSATACCGTYLAALTTDRSTAVFGAVPLVSDSRFLARSPGPVGVPSVSLGADPVFSGERFLLLMECAAQEPFPKNFKIL
jgi:hypothetical protein